MSHALTTAAEVLTLAEKRVVVYAVAKQDRFKSDGGMPNFTVKLVANDYAEQFGEDADTAYPQLRQAGKCIFNCNINTVRKITALRFELKRGPQQDLV